MSNDKNKGFILYNLIINTIIDLFLVSTIVFSFIFKEIEIINLLILIISFIIYFISTWEVDYKPKVIMKATTLSILIISAVLIYRGSNNPVSSFFQSHYELIIILLSLVYFFNEIMWHKKDFESKKKKEKEDLIKKSEHNELMKNLNDMKVLSNSILNSTQELRELINKIK